MNPTRHAKAEREARRASHDCARERCDDDPRDVEQVEQEGYDAAARGLGYDDCPYGLTHPDRRFNWWVTGNSRAWAHRGPLIQGLAATAWEVYSVGGNGEGWTFDDCLTALAYIVAPDTLTDAAKRRFATIFGNEPAAARPREVRRDPRP